MKAAKRMTREKPDVGFSVWITFFEYTIVGAVILWLWLMISNR